MVPLGTQGPVQSVLGWVGGITAKIGAGCRTVRLASAQGSGSQTAGDSANTSSTQTEAVHECPARACVQLAPGGTSCQASQLLTLPAGACVLAL